MDWGAIGNLGLAGVALVAMAWVLIENSKNKKAEAKAETKEESPTIPADAFAKMVAAAVSEANKPMRDLVGNNTEAIENNTRAINDMRVSLAQINGKSDNILGNTNLMLQRGRNGGGGEC